LKGPDDPKPRPKRRMACNGFYRPIAAVSHFGTGAGFDRRAARKAHIRIDIGEDADIGEVDDYNPSNSYDYYCR